MLKRIQAVSKLPEKEKEYVFLFLDAFIDRMKLRESYKAKKPRIGALGYKALMDA